MQVSVTRANAMLKLWEPLTVGMSKAVPIAFTFSPDWDGLSKVAVFTAGTTQIDVLDTSWASESVCFVPPEVLTTVGDRVNVGVYGTNADNAVVIPTVWVNLGRVQPAPDPSGDPTTDPTLPVWAQIQAKMIDSAEVNSDGELVLTLHDGTELNLGSVIGPEGPQGPEGQTGQTGPEGPAGPGVPAGGTFGQYLVKGIGGDYQAIWQDLPASAEGQFTILAQNSIVYPGVFEAISTGADLLSAINAGRPIVMRFTDSANGSAQHDLYLNNLSIETGDSSTIVYALFYGVDNNYGSDHYDDTQELRIWKLISTSAEQDALSGTVEYISIPLTHGSGGTSDYDQLSNRPQINGNTLTGNKTAAQLGLGTYRKPSGGIPKTDLASAVQTSLGKADTALQTAPVQSVNGQTGSVVLGASDVGAATEGYVDSAISQSTAFYRGNFATRAALLAVAWQTTNPQGANYVTNNDYAVVLDDETQSDECWRYIYVTGSGWTAQYRINETPLTQAQLDAVNSGATAAKINQIATNTTAISGKITAPSSPSVGDFLVYGASGWTAQTLAVWQGGSY